MSTPPSHDSRIVVFHPNDTHTPRGGRRGFKAHDKGVYTRIQIRRASRGEYLLVLFHRVPWLLLDTILQRPATDCRFFSRLQTKRVLRENMGNRIPPNRLGADVPFHRPQTKDSIRFWIHFLHDVLRRVFQRRIFTQENRQELPRVIGGI